jgi:hypothetical protein
MDCAYASNDMFQVSGGDPVEQGYVANLTPQVNRFAVSGGGHIPALLTHCRLFDYGLGRVYGGWELLSFQGFHPGHLAMQLEGPTQLQYPLANRLAGNAMTVSVVAAALTAVVCFVLPGATDLPPLALPGPRAPPDPSTTEEGSASEEVHSPSLPALGQ